MKTVLITGASRGIGRQLAKTYAKNGYTVIINYNKSEEKAKDVFNEIISNKGNAVLVKADISKEVEVKEMVNYIIKNFKHIDVLINNAGICYKGLLIDEMCDVTENLISTNLTSMINVSKFVIPHMIANEKGRIINMSSIWGQVGAAFEATYSASKAGIIGLTKALAKEYAYNNINVNCICPGVIDTDMNKSISEEDMQDLINQIPMQRLGKTEEVANLALFLTESTGDYITGQVITIDGGFTL